MDLSPGELVLKEELLNQNFRPTRPVDDQSIFAGRNSQLSQALDAIGMPGQHVVIHGERGVGKTSLANIATKIASEAPESRTLAVSVTCNNDDTFPSVWKRVMRQVPLASSGGSTAQVQMTFEPALGYNVTPDEVHRVLVDATYNRKLVIVVDEFDQIQNEHHQTRFSNTIKALSDHGVQATVVLVGVAKSVGALLKGHQSVERNLAQVSMPRMSGDELREVLKNGLEPAAMTISREARDFIASISQGLPNYAHLLGLHSGKAALDRKSADVVMADVNIAISRAITQAQESIKTAYHTATDSPRKESIYRHVLLACALAPADAMNSFAPSDVRSPLERVIGKEYHIRAFLQHLKGFTQAQRGEILQQTGGSRRFRYSFTNPLMRPYVIMRGLEDKLISEKDV